LISDPVDYFCREHHAFPCNRWRFTTFRKNRKSGKTAP
jgi:hypothetical protein